METKWDWLDATASGGKKWVPYEDQYQDIFNLALKNNNPKVSFLLLKLNLNSVFNC